MHTFSKFEKKEAYFHSNIASVFIVWNKNIQISFKGKRQDNNSLDCMSQKICVYNAKITDFSKKCIEKDEFINCELLSFTEFE